MGPAKIVLRYIVSDIGTLRSNKLQRCALEAF